MPDIFDQYNPYLSYRDGQKEAIRDIVEAAEEGAHIIQLDAGVGSGKSLILSVAAMVLLREMSLEKAIYTTPQVKLVEQLRADEHLRIPVLVGKKNYPCTAYADSELDITADTCPLPRKQRKELCPDCPYTLAKEAFKMARLGAVTLDKLLFDPFVRDGLDILIIDESSGIEQKLINQSEIKLPYKVHPSDPIPGLEEWAKDTAAELVEATGSQELLGEAVISGDAGALGKSIRASKKVKSLELQQKKIEYLLDIIGQGQQYVIDGDRKFRTLDGRRQFAKLVDGPQVVLMASGTPCPQMVCSKYTTVCMANPIPAEKRLVYFDPVGKMSAACREKTIDVMAPKIAALHKEHGHNTLVHCHSYPCAESLGSALIDEGARTIIMDRDNKDRKEDIIKSWMKNDGAILASVGCEEGLDLAGPKFPLNVVAVVPFPFRGDEWVLKREEADKQRPYHQQHGIMSTAIAIQQATGRTTRGPDDFSQTWVLDSNFGWFVKRYRNAFKPDFLRSVMVSRPRGAMA